MAKYIHSSDFARRLCKFQAIDEHSANAVISLLYAVPAADVVEVKHGYWIKVGKTEGRSNILQCSVCGKVRRGIAKTPYCKDCGAKMDAERKTP